MKRFPKLNPKTMQVTLSRERGMNTPPSLSSNVTLNHTFRFVSASSTVQAITAKSLCLAAGCTGTVTNTTVTSPFASVKLNHISIWSPPSSQGSAVTCSVEWASQSNANNREVSDTSVSVATPAHIRSRPPLNSLASFWQAPGIADNQLCNLVAPSGSIIDVNLSLIMQDDDNGSAITRSVATAVIGTIYYLALDNATGHVYTPVSLTTTF
jgi:hypothetical protein